MPTTDPIYLGIDLGTGGVRAVAVTTDGEVVAEGQYTLSADSVRQQDDRHEQDADTWLVGTQMAMAQLEVALLEGGRWLSSVAAIAIDGTSGTIVPVDQFGYPWAPALMYNDGRASAEAEELTAIARQSGSDITIAPSYAAARIRWFQKHQPDVFANTHCFAHQADYVQWFLLGHRCPDARTPIQTPLSTDYSNALKTGYDLNKEGWPDWWTAIEGIKDRLPDVVPPGTVVGVIDEVIARSSRLSPDTKIITGCSDGTAGFLASGAKNVGDDNTTLGTTLVFKRIADKPVNNELVYSHKLPGGRWLPGAASNTGGEWIRQQFGGADLAALDAQAKAILPIDVLAYPLARTGERFPFRSADATAFIQTDTNLNINDTAIRYAAMLQGTALFERLCYEQLDRETGTNSTEAGDIYATGGGAKSDVWLQLRADVTGRTIHVPAYPESAFGAAVLAASGATGTPLRDMIDQMVRIERTFTPDPNVRVRYDNLYEKFKAAMRERFAV